MYYPIHTGDVRLGTHSPAPQLRHSGGSKTNEQIFNICTEGVVRYINDINLLGETKSDIREIDMNKVSLV